MTLLHGFGYPNLKRTDVRPFLSRVLVFVERRLPKNRSEATRLLKQCLRKTRKLADLELAFLHDEESGELIKDFSIHFMHSTWERQERG